MNTPTEIYAFIKFTEAKYESSFLDEGLLYMNNLEFYQDHAKRGIHGDPDEGLMRSLRASDYDFYVAGKKLTGVIDRIRISSGQERNTFLFCLTQLNNAMLHPSITEFAPDARFREFGDHAVIIPANNWPAFTKRLNEKLNSLFDSKIITYFQGDEVTYVPETYNEQLGPLKKFSSFAWQQEWRLIIQTKEPADAFTELKLGNIRDLVMAYPTEELMRKKFQVKPRLP